MSLARVASGDSPHRNPRGKQTLLAEARKGEADPGDDTPG